MIVDRLSEDPHTAGALDSRLHNVAETKCDGSLISAAVKCRNADHITATITTPSSSSSSAAAAAAAAIRYYATCYRA